MESPITPSTPIKVERVPDSLTDIYDASPRGRVYKAADLGRRQTSRSTAQLTTPASSPERKNEKRDTIREAPIVKLEFNHEIDGRQSVFDSSCTPPASSPERSSLSKSPASKKPSMTPQQSPSKALQAPADSPDIRESSSRAEGNSTTATLRQRPTLGRHSGLQSATVSGGQPYAPTSRVSKPQRDSEKPAACASLGGKTRTDYRPILAPSKVRPSASKITTRPSPTRTVSTPSSTSQELLPSRDTTSTEKACCKLMCLQCTPKDVLEEYGLGLPEPRPNIPRLKSMSACPSSVSSFGPNDDIPPSNKQHREVGRAITESTNTFASDQLSEISPSLRYSDLLARLRINRPSPTGNGDRNDVYNDFEESLPQKDPCRVIFGKAEKVVADHGRRDVTGTSQHSHSIKDDIRKGDKKLQRILSRSLRSFSAANDLSKKSQNLDHEISWADEDNSPNEASNIPLGSESRGEDVDSGSEYEERTSRKASSRAPLRVKSSGQSIKRAREVIDDWKLTFSDDEDMADEDDIVEINRDVFDLSENRRKKRHKSKPQDANRNPTPGNLVPKEEELTGSDEISPAAHDSGITEVIGKNTTGKRVSLIIDAGLLYNINH